MTKVMLKSPTYGEVFFDAVFNTDHNLTVIPTDHPVQSGASITDHAYVAPDEISMTIGMTDTVSGTGGGSRSLSAYAMLRDLAALREPMRVTTRLFTYDSMLIVSISATDDHTSMHALRATITLREIKMVAVATVTVQQTTSGSKAKSKTKSKSKTKTSSTKTSSASASSSNTSVLASAANKLK